MDDSDRTLRDALDTLTLPEGSPQLESLPDETRTAVKQSQSWLLGPNVVGAGVAPKVTAGQTLETLAIKVYVVGRLPLAELPEKYRVPESLNVPGVPGDLVTDVEAIGEQWLQVESDRRRPAYPGISVGLLAGDTGTLGCIVEKTENPENRYILSNSHVLALSGLAEVGAPVAQPGKLDGGRDDDVLADFSEAVTFNFEPGFNNLCDAAIAKVRASGDVLSQVPEIGTLRGFRKQADLKRGMQVQKTGRTTGHTIGTIKDTAYRTFMPYRQPDGRTSSAGFRDQVLCQRYTDSGDSGAVVLDMDGFVVGLHWCGSVSTSVFSPIEFVFDALKIDLVTG
jgi:hypothetical protein